MRGKMESLVRSLEKGSLALTVNRRLSRHIVNSYDAAMKGEGRRFWRSPSVVPFSAWIESLLDPAPLPVLDAARARALWESIVEKDLGRAASRASKASFDAMMLMGEYMMELPQDIYLTEEARALKRWMKAYDGAVKGLGFTGPEKKAAVAVKNLREGATDAPPPIILAGFDELTPAARMIIDELQRRGADVSFWPDAPGSADDAPLDASIVTVRPYADEVEEAVQAARWARANASPGVRLGFIVPEIERYRDLIIREFTHELDPAGVLDAHRGRVFNISLGTPLSAEPIVAAALAILSVTAGAEELSGIFNAVLTPYLAADEGYILTRLDARMRRENVSKTSLRDIRKRLKGKSRALAIIEAWTGELREGRAKELPSAWAGRFSRMLARLGFPAPRLTSREFQAIKAWTELLGAFSRLDAVTGRLTRAEAAGRLKRLANDTVHQSETPESDRCGIQVMGLLEAAGQEFDKVWLMGCHEGALPASPEPNPFIPLNLQKKFGLPRSSPEKELLFARSALKRLIDGAATVEVSFPKTSGDRALFISPFFRCVTPSKEIYINGSSRLKDAMNRAGGLAAGRAEADVPIAPGELSGIKGGTGIIKNQSLCPFRAFAAHRLNARPVPVPEFGLTPAQRGDAAHRALKAFWTNVGDSERLKGLIENSELEREVERAIDAAFAGMTVSTPRLMAMEKDRLRRTMNDWLTAESGRASFSVAELEERRQITIKDLTIEGKPDRIDVLSDGRTVCIDYKTGNAVDRKDWLTERPRDPQLIIYAVDRGLDALAFARLIPGECGFIGTSRSGGVFPGVKPFGEDKKWKESLNVPDWEGLMDFWKRSIEALAGEFLSGINRVDPTGAGMELACNTCDFKALCRITEAEEIAEGGEA